MMTLGTWARGAEQLLAAGYVFHWDGVPLEKAMLHFGPEIVVSGDSELIVLGKSRERSFKDVIDRSHFVLGDSMDV